MEEDNKAYIASKLKEVIGPMIAQVVLQRPENVPEFMLEWLKKTYNRSGPSEENAGSENESSSDEASFGKLR